MPYFGWGRLGDGVADFGTLNRGNRLDSDVVAELALRCLPIVGFRMQTARIGRKFGRRLALATPPAFFERGAVAQLGERLNGIQEVDGSIPFGSTK